MVVAAAVTPDGLTIAPLYTRADAPLAAHLTTAPRDPERPWDLRTATAHPSPELANTEIITDLEGGGASVIVRIDPSGRNGVAIVSKGTSVADAEAATAEVTVIMQRLGLAPIQGEPAA